MIELVLLRLLLLCLESNLNDQLESVDNYLIYLLHWVVCRA